MISVRRILKNHKPIHEKAMVVPFNFPMVPSSALRGYSMTDQNVVECWLMQAQTRHNRKENNITEVMRKQGLPFCMHFGVRVDQAALPERQEGTPSRSALAAAPDTHNTRDTRYIHNTHHIQPHTVNNHNTQFTGQP